MKLRNHIAHVVCLVVALASHYLGGAAVAQQAFPATPFMPCARQSCWGDRFYVQGGVQYRVLQRLGFQKNAHTLRYSQPVQDPNNPGVFYVDGKPPFGPNQAGNFGTGTGVPGYEEFGPPTGNCKDDPRQSGIWHYNDGYITPVGLTSGDTVVSTLWPQDWVNSGWQLPSLGQYRTSGGGVDVGQFVMLNTTKQVLSGYPGIYGTPQSSGFEPETPGSNTATFKATPKAQTFAVAWQRMIDETVSIPPEHGVPSRIWQATGPGADIDYSEQIWCPTVEIGVQATSFFDIFYGLTWFDLEKSTAKVFISKADLYRRTFKDTFPFYSDDSGNWIPGSFMSDVRPSGTNVNQQINPDGNGVGGFPNRQFFELLDGKGASSFPPVFVTETIGLRTDATVYENRLGARSWTPLYGMGRFGVTFGPLMNLIYYRASSSVTEVYSGGIGVAHTDNWASLSKGWITGFGLFTAVDAEFDWNGYFFKTNAQYSWCEEKQAQNSHYLYTNLNVGGFSSILVGGVRF